ncbi:PREDICTED: uncharacterized protein LOC104811785 [Tarenaya hassleriana]|uniref:uncharacterized protein LOC104811785 n=1 Tax=Tarenaya hassleriana TaxID=28532 RepID=UPI00053C3E59|nr:PREDICTED: uncharacterized protein LOC104811785 [Tarenaya hassleriana]
MMDHEYCINPTPKASLLLMEDDLCKRAISRNSSAGCSSRMCLYYRSPGGVPFDWETQPGTPIDPPPEEIVPPISPPPAMLSLGLPKPSISVGESKPSFFPVRLKLWKHLRRSRYFSRWRDHGVLSRRDYNARGGDGNSYSGSERYVDFDVIYSTSSSCSSLSSSSGNNDRNLSKDRSLTSASRHGFHGCSPWNLRNMRPVFVRVPRK